ncbi:MAG: hypothetical protein H7A51_13600 [Akkermansiaceae bacterium]|nr:hypothetical protein [Akkermansiaceae bacterium]
MSWKLKPFPEAFIDPKSFINNGISAMRQGNTEHEESIIIERKDQPPTNNVKIPKTDIRSETDARLLTGNGSDASPCSIFTDQCA